MGIAVTDEQVERYTTAVRSGAPTKDLFPARMSECAFTETQRESIRQARVARRAERKPERQTNETSQAPPAAPTGSNSKQSPETATPAGPASKALTKLQRLLFLQHGKCFFCGQQLPEALASIEHLQPKSRGGPSDESNEVVCHKSLNQAFGDMTLKQKFAFILKSDGSLKCPGT